MVYTLEDFITCENGTPEGRSNRYSRATLPINQLKEIYRLQNNPTLNSRNLECLNM